MLSRPRRVIYTFATKGIHLPRSSRILRGFSYALLHGAATGSLHVAQFSRRFKIIIHKISNRRAAATKQRLEQLNQKEPDIEKLKAEISHVSSVLLSARAMETLAEHRPKLVENLVLDYIRTHKDCFSVTQCSRELGLSQSTLRRILKHLTKKGIIHLAPA